ncbi:transport and Golgi organization protein 6 homolog isoform 2-T2 [Clarias gariepinus]|uniref:transport and Golgi organization protein 6 homolog isoform X2 n=1 Tax=Clarias gariepinus TaxID=13013 RepID=UPI00234DC77A|nr:transport and Golgi organization protein 6 homolog isoform X2 [Clarias gariepinus]
MTTEIITALSVLTKPIREANLGGSQSTQQEVLVSALQRNQLELKRMLDGGELEEARRLLEEVRTETQWFCAHTEDLTWSFVQECLLLLLCLARNLCRLVEAFNRDSCPAVSNPRTPEAAPPLPPDVLSVAQQKTLGTVLQFLVTLGLCPYLVPGVGVSLALRSAFGVAVEGAVRRDVAPPCERRLFITTTVFLEVAAHSSLATLVFTRHLGDLMAALCQLGYRPHRPVGESAESSKGLTVEERKTSKQELQNLLGRVYQPIAIKELLVLQGGPKAGPGSKLPQAPPWLRRLCGQLLSERLMQPHGVQAVVRAILEGTGGGDSDWRKCDAVAKILATCPQQSLSAESYYSQVCPQVLELLHFTDKITALQFQRVATRVVLTMVQDQPEFAQRFLVTPLLSPLQHCASVPEAANPTGEDVVPEFELTRCVEDVYKIFVVGNSPSGILPCALGDVIPTIFSLFCYTKQNVSHLRNPCHEILQWYLSHVEHSTALLLLKYLCDVQGGQGGVAPDYQFSPGSEGGVRLTLKDPVSAEDDMLYEKVSGDQWKVECVVQLLADMKDSDLPGEFFLSLLQDLTDMAAEQHEPEKDVDTSSMTLLELEKHLTGCVSGYDQRLALLQTLAVMCEILPHTQLLRKATQVVSFIESMLQRACVSLEHGSESLIESQTLSMGMGLVATLLSGAAELTSEDYSSMARLLAPLEQISHQHPELVIQELASDLRATIATRGAYHSDSVNNAAQFYSHSGYAQTKDGVPSQKPGNFVKPVGISDSPQSPVSKNLEMPHVIQQSPNVPLSCSSANSQSDGLMPSLSQNTACHGTVNSSAEMREQAQSFQHTDERNGKSFRPKSAASTNMSASTAPPEKVFSEWLLEACDPDVPTRAMALRALSQCVKEGTKESTQARDKLLMIFLENLEHEDSFVYLSAIQGLVFLADSFPEQILQRLLAEYQPALSAASSSRGRCLETRLKVGEALMRASRAMGDLAPHYGRPLIGAFLSGTRDEDSSVRASCLSNLGELCQRLNFSLGPLAQELSMCLTTLIKTEKQAEVRRAAVHVIALLLRGLSDKTTQVLGDVLLKLYRALKWVVRSDSDEVAVLHAHLALEELDDIMRKFIFPQQKLEKKIVVLP